MLFFDGRDLRIELSRDGLGDAGRDFDSDLLEPDR